MDGFRWAFAFVVFPLFLFVSCGRKAPGPLPVQKALESFRFSDEFRAELFAAEPDVVDPVDMVFDENGRAFVAEMLDYPDDPPPGKPARSRIRLLEDTNGDGKADRSIIFADRLLEVSGLLPWRGGLIVTSAPDILYLKDTDGDGKADARRVLYTGFPKVNPEGRITNPRLGIDNWIYFSNNGADGAITSPEHPERPPVLVRGADFRMHPLKGIAEPAAGPAQYGSTFDDWGNRFITQNTIHLRHVVVPMRYLTRAPLLIVSAVSQDISDHGRPSARMFPLTGPQAWRVERTRLRQQRYDEQGLNRTERVAGYFTAATGSTVYTGDVFPEEYWGNVFTGDVSGNLVHRDILKQDGVTFSASRGKDGVEFLASTDPWFRPCSFANAPDGSLYLMDIYREFIETPESIPEELKKSMDFWSGDTMGRIYRIVPNKPQRRRDLRPNLGSASSAELVRQLESTNGWHRSTAQRLLVERQDRSVASLLREMALKSRLPQARLRALWTLEGLSALDELVVIRAFSDRHPRIRENAIRISESSPQTASLRDALLKLKQDPDQRVQFQLAATLGSWKDPRVMSTLADLASDHAGDHWFRIAVLSSVADAPERFLEVLLQRGSAAWQNAEFLAQIGSLVGARHESQEIGRFLAAAARLRTPESALTGLAAGLQLARVSGLRVGAAEAALTRFLNSPSQEVQKAAWDVARFFELRTLIGKAAEIAVAENLPVEKRTAAIRALRGGSYATAASISAKVLASNPPSALQVAAVDTLAAFDDPGVPEVLLRGWQQYAPEARARVLGALLNRPERAAALMDAVESGRVEPGALDVAARAKLLEYSDSRIAERARRLFRNLGGDRAKVVESYRAALSLRGDVNRGRKLFEDNCARCHLATKKGGRVGPDLSGINNKTKEELLTAILNPSYSIESRYVNYIVTTRNGQMFDGVLANETPGAITLRGGPEGDVTILRRNISEIRSSSISLMPEDLEQSLSRQGIADVIAYLRGGL